jgi:transposase
VISRAAGGGLTALAESRAARSTFHGVQPRYNSDIRGVARPGRHDETARGTVITLARTKPRSLGYPFELWTLARLQRAIQERVGLQVAQGTIWKWLQAEGLVWKRQRSWFQVTVDAAFAEKRGPSSRRTRSRSQRGGSSASMSWVP